MKRHDPLERIEALAPVLRCDHPPVVRVAPQVMRRVRAVETAADRTLALFAAGSCLVAVAVLAVGLSFLGQASDPLGALFQIVPPIDF